MAYSSSLSDQEWKLIEPLLPQKQTRPPLWSKRQILDGVFYQLKTAAIGVTYPEICLTQRCFGTTSSGEKLVLDEIMDKLHGKVREQAQKNRSGPLIMIDSQAVKNTCNASIASKGFVTTKQRMGSKGIWLSILGFPSSLTVPKPTSLTTRD